MKLKRSLVAGLALLSWGSVFISAGLAAEPDYGKELLKKIPNLQQFIAAKEKQARADTAQAKETVSPDVWTFFKLAGHGEWTQATNLFKSLVQRSSHYAGPIGEHPGPQDPTIRNAAWQPTLEVELVLEAFAAGQSKYAEAFGRGIVTSIPRGAIYFGGTEPGRGLPTCFSQSHADAEPFFTITQRALTDGLYLNYIRRMYGNKIYIPSTNDSQRVFQEYLADAQRRLEHDRAHPNEPRQIKPGEDVRVVDNRVQVSGHVALMSINGLLTRMIFDHNPDREFYVEESYPLDWMYSHLSPHGLIMKINRHPLASLSEDVVRQDHRFWSKQVASMLGDRLAQDTSVEQVCNFAERVYAEKNMTQFQGDPLFVKDENACKVFAKLRNSIAGVYAWRGQHAKSPDDQQRMMKAADFAFRQAFALCPSSPEVIFRYINLLVSMGPLRIEDAQRIAATARKLNPGNGSFKNLVQELERSKQQQIQPAVPPTLNEPPTIL